MSLALLALGPWMSSAHALEHGVNLRLRTGFVPKSILDAWYFDEDDDGALPYPRTGIGMSVFGLEYSVAGDIQGANGIFWIERVPIRMDAGYWDDREDPAEHRDGDWLAPQDGLGVWAFGVNYAHELPLTETAKPVWLSLMFGGGLGLGIATGGITQWHPGVSPDLEDPTCGVDATAPERATELGCGDDGEVALPGVVPVIDFTASARLHVTEYGSLRLDLGLHDMLYAGLAAGATF